MRLLEAVGVDFHVSFYIPVYAAMALGEYDEADLPPELRSVAFRDGEYRLVAGEADLLVAAPMRTMRLFEHTGRRIVSFAEIASRQPFCLVTREPQPDFKWANLSGERVINFGEAETPILCLRYVLAQEGVPAGDVRFLEHLTIPEALDAFRAGAAKYLLHPLDTAEELIESGEAYMAAPLGPAVGHVPFTTWAATPSFLESHRESVEQFCRGHAAALAWLGTHSSVDIVELVGKFFSTPKQRLVRIVDRYKELSLWPETPTLERESFEFYRGLLSSTGWIDGRVSYEDIATDAFAHPR
jgi:NitT/TauT family transport system substrate-binding protein